MEITLFQAVLIALWTGLCLAGMLLGIYTNRCLIMATGVGLILGDPVTGLAMGAVGELAFMGYGVSQGGSIPPTIWALVSWAPSWPSLRASVSKLRWPCPFPLRWASSSC